MIKLRNSNFINEQMSIKDISFAFEKDSKIPIKTFIYDNLIEEGYIKKTGRYFAPTQKLYDLAFVPEFFEIEEHKRRWLNTTKKFYAKDFIQYILDGNKHIFNAMLRIGMVKLMSDKRYTKSEVFENLLAEGETLFKIK